MLQSHRINRLIEVVSPQRRAAAQRASQVAAAQRTIANTYALPSQIEWAYDLLFALGVAPVHEANATPVLA